MSPLEKSREARLRRMAKRQGWRLDKSRRRDPRALDYGRYWLVDVTERSGETTVLGGQYGMSLDEVEDHLTRGGAPRQ